MRCEVGVCPAGARSRGSAGLLFSAGGNIDSRQTVQQNHASFIRQSASDDCGERNQDHGCSQQRSGGTERQQGELESDVALVSPRCGDLDDGWCRRFLARHGTRINRDGELVLHSEQYRDQGRNLADVRQKLVNMLLECQSAPKSRKATQPTRGSQRRRLDQKRRQSQKKVNRRSPSRED